MKKKLAMVLSIALTLSTLPSGVFAEDVIGNLKTENEVVVVKAEATVEEEPGAEDRQTVNSEEALRAVVEELNTSGGKKIITLGDDISITKPISISQGTLTILGDNHLINSDYSTDSLFELSGEATLNLGDENYEGNESYDGDVDYDTFAMPLRILLNCNESMIYLRDNSKLNIYKGVVLENKGTTIGTSGAIYAENDSMITMNGGVIRNCHSAFTAGAIHLRHSAEFNMYNGLIEKCNGIFGGAVLMMDDPTESMPAARFNMYDGTISECSATVGGAVCVDSKANFLMNDGIIKNCKATQFGGAVYTSTVGTVEFNMGSIFNNNANTAGGGIFTGKPTDEAGNPMFADETAVVTVSDGMAIYSNSANVMGDDIFNNAATLELGSLAQDLKDESGHKIDGWYLDMVDEDTGLERWSADSENNQLIDPKTFTEAIGLKAAYGTNKEYTVTYTDGVDGTEVFADQVFANISSGDPLPAFVGTPERNGYTFVGWYDENAKKVESDAVVMSDMMLTAHWRVNYRMNIGTYAVEPTKDLYEGNLDANDREQIDVHAGDIVTVRVWVSPEEGVSEADDTRFTNALWTVKYDHDKFEFIGHKGHEAENSYTITENSAYQNDTLDTTVLGTTGRDEFETGEDNYLVEYTFKAITQQVFDGMTLEDIGNGMKGIKGLFEISETYVNTYDDAINNDKIKATNNKFAVANIVVKNDLAITLESTLEDGTPDPSFDAKTNKIERIYDASTSTIKGVPNVEGAKVYYSTDGGVTWTESAPSYKNVTGVGEYEDITQTVKIKAVMPGYTDAEAEATVAIKQRQPEIEIVKHEVMNQAFPTRVQFDIEMTNLVDNSYMGRVWLEIDGKAYDVDVTYEENSRVTGNGKAVGSIVIDNIKSSYEAVARYTEGVNDNYMSAISDPVSDVIYFIEVVNAKYNSGSEDSLPDYVAGAANENGTQQGYIYVLVYTDEDDLHFEYDNVLMYDVTASGYQYRDDDGKTYKYPFKHIYGLVVPALDEYNAETGVSFNPDNYRASITVAEGDAEPVVINPYDEDVNYTDLVDINDVSANFAVYNARTNYMESVMKTVLKGDVNRDKMVDLNDINLIKKKAHIK